MHHDSRYFGLKFSFLFLCTLVLQAAPTAPTNLLLTPSSHGVTLSWQDHSTNETGFKIYRDGNLIQKVPTDTTSYHDSGLETKTTYRYMVKAMDGIGEDKKATLISPLNASTSHRPIFRWKMIDEASTYTIMVRPLLENGTDPDWSRTIYNANDLSEAEANCDTQTRICSLSPDISISGNHVWWIKSSGEDDWSERGYFSVNGYDGALALNDGTSGITRGYGVWGNYKVADAQEEYYYGDAAHPDNITGYITTYHPDITTRELPVLFFISGWGRPAYSYDTYFKFLASHGYYVVNVYDDAITAAGLDKDYHDDLAMIEQAANNHATWMDLTKVGLMGHSTGAGATVWLGKEIFGGNKNWGSAGRFLFLNAPWYSLLVNAADLTNYPANTKLLVQFSNDEEGRNGKARATDPRVVRAMYELINIPDADKDFITLLSDNKHYTYAGVAYTYRANHYVSYPGVNNSEGVYQPYDMLDLLLLNRLSHAMLNLVFQGDEDARKVALGNGSIEQKSMKNEAISLVDLKVTDTPIVDINRPQEDYAYTCSGGWYDDWKLAGYCDDANQNGIIDVLE